MNRRNESAVTGRPSSSDPFMTSTPSASGDPAGAASARPSGSWNAVHLQSHGIGHPVDEARRLSEPPSRDLEPRIVLVPVERESRWRVPRLDPREGCELADALEAHREHVRDVLIKPPGLIDDPGVDLPVLGEVRAAVDVMGVLDAVRRRRGHGVQIDRDGASRLNRRTTYRTRGIGMVREVHEDAVAGEGDREQLVERPVQIGQEEMALGAGNRARITAFSHRGSFPTPAGAAGSRTCARVQLGW